MWDALVAWFQSPGGARVLQTAIIPALAILVAGVLAALIARSAVRAVIRRSERAEASSTVAALVAAARAAADPDADRGTKRRAARLRTEADVRTRLLPLKGAESAADWAASRIDAVQQRAADGPVSRELDELRDRLVDWVGHPSRAKRIFAAPAAPADGEKKVSDTVKAEPVPAERAAATPAAVPAEPAQQDAERSEPDRFARPPVVPGPRRGAPEPEVQPAAAAPQTDSPAPALASTPSPAVAVAAGEVPAWQRTRAGGRLQQERGRSRPLDAPADEEEETLAPAPESTAPAQLQHAHRAPSTLAADADEASRLEAIRLEAHQQARHARPDQPATGATTTTTATSTDPVAPAAAATPAPPATSATPTPAWLDTYDDEAQVTQNLDLKTPPPVSASSVRGRGTPGEDLVPRS